MLIRVNDQEVELKEGSTIKDAIIATNAPYQEGSILTVVQGTEEFESHIDKYKIKTDQGSIILQMIENSDSEEIIKIWKSRYKEFADTTIMWTSSEELAIGPISTDFEPTREEYQYKEGDVVLSLAGFSKDSTHIIFVKEDHKATYGAPDYNKGIFATVVGGKRTLTKLTNRNIIKSIEPVAERSSLTKSKTITDINTKLEDGNQIYTYALIEPIKESPESVDQLLALTKDDKIKVNYDTNTFLGFYELQKIQKNPELIDQRKRGTITVRNTGAGVGNIYIYREDRVSTPSHTVVANVTKGMELIDIAKEGEQITIKTNPERIMTLGLTQKEAEEHLKKHNIQHIRDGLTDDDALIVEQTPKYTMQIVDEKQVKTLGIKPDKLIEIEFTDNAPRSVWYFKKITGLLDAPLGSLKVYFAVSDMGLVMFKGDESEAKGLKPENSPEKYIGGTIGITNMSRKNVGLIGIRFDDNDEFGPTGEKFNATNIIGRITNGIENLKKIKEGDTVYVIEK